MGLVISILALLVSITFNLLHLKWRNEGRAICGGCLVFVAGLCSVVELELLNGDVSSSPMTAAKTNPNGTSQRTLGY